MWRDARGFGVGIVLALGACTRPEPGRRNDTVPTPPTPPETTVTPSVAAPIAWDTAAGPAFLVLGPSPGQGAVIVPGIDSSASLDTVRIDTDRYRTLTLDLFRSGRRVGAATVRGTVTTDVPEDCSAWPVVSIDAARDSAGAGWAVAFAADRLQPLGIDSLASHARPDSLRLTGELARVASSAPGDTVEALRGIPFVVQRAYRATLPDGTSLVMAEVGRALNQEANPIQEHLLLVTERDSASSRQKLAYVERTAGGEETLESVELLALGVVRGRTQPVLLVARYLGDGVVYSLIERVAAGQWRLRWSSPYAGC